MHELHTRIEIAATPEQVWDVLIDLAAYSRWNPFIRHVDGVPEEGRSLALYGHLAGARRTRLRAVISKIDAPHEMCRRTRLVTPGVFAREHRFVRAPLPGGNAQLEQSLRVGRLLAPLLRERIERNVGRAFREMNAALKGRVERACDGSASRRD